MLTLPRWKDLPARLARVTSSGRFIPEIDGLRFIAIALVVVFHECSTLHISERISEAAVQSSWMFQIFKYGAYGVELFFVISGFVVALPFASHYLGGTPAVSIKQYFLRRVTRLEPPYFLSMLLFYFLLSIMRGHFLFLAPHLGASLLYSHGIIFNAASPVNMVAWSLEVEIQFYLLAPLLCLVYRLRPTLLRRVMIIACAGVMMYFQLGFVQYRMWASVLGNIQYFLAGMLLADIYVNDWKQKPTRHAAWDVVSLVGWPLLWWTMSLTVWADIIIPILMLLLYMAAFRGKATSALLRNRWITATGGMCYTIYLLHGRILSAMQPILMRCVVGDNFTLNILIALLIALPVVMAISVAFYLLIEKPCMRKDWPRQLLSRLQKPKALAASV